jgi:hypothetical protein
METKMDTNSSGSRPTERPCIFFLLTIIALCVVVASVTVQVVRFLIHFVSRGPVADNWVLFLAIGIAIAAIIAAVRLFVHSRHRTHGTTAGARIAH